MKNPYELLSLAQEIRAVFIDMINRGASQNYCNQVVDIKDKYFNQVDGDFDFEGTILKLGKEKAEEMLKELRALNN